MVEGFEDEQRAKEAGKVGRWVTWWVGRIDTQKQSSTEESYVDEDANEKGREERESGGWS